MKRLFAALILCAGVALAQTNVVYTQQIQAQGGMAMGSMVANEGMFIEVYRDNTITGNGSGTEQLIDVAIQYSIH